MVQSGVDDCVLAIGEGWLEYLGYDAAVYSLHQRGLTKMLWWLQSVLSLTAWSIAMCVTNI